MSSIKMQHVMKLLVVCGLPLIVTGCSDEELRKSVNTFDKSMSSSSSAIRDFYLSMNDNAREKYFLEARFDPVKLLSTYEMKDGERANSPIKNAIEPQYIEARIKVLSLLGNYSEGLGLIATSKAPEEVQAELEKVGANIQQIHSDLKPLLGVEDTSGADLGNYSKFVGTIGGMSMKAYLNLKKDAALRKYVKEGEESADELFRLLKTDLNETSLKYQRDANQKLKYFVNYYNRQYTRASYDAQKSNLPTAKDRVAFLAETEEAAKEVNSISQGNPAELIDKLSQVHANLVICAKKKCQSKDVIARLLDDFQAVLVEANKVSEAVKSLKEKR